MSLCGPTACDLSVDPTSQVRSPAMLVLVIAGRLKLRFYGRAQWHNVHAKFHPNPSISSQDESCEQTGSALWTA